MLPPEAKRAKSCKTPDRNERFQWQLVTSITWTDVKDVNIASISSAVVIVKVKRVQITVKSLLSATGKYPTKKIAL